MKQFPILAIYAVGLSTAAVVACGDVVTRNSDDTKSALTESSCGGDASIPGDSGDASWNPADAGTPPYDSGDGGSWDGGGWDSGSSDGGGGGPDSGDGGGWTGGGWIGDGGVIDDSYVLTDGGTCSGYTQDQGPVDPTYGCRVAVSVTNSKLDYLDGQEGAGVLVGDTLHVQCKKDGTPIMEARIDCFQGAGEYVIPAGGILLGQQLSDRPCRFQAYLYYGRVGGLITCDDHTGSGTELFGSSTAPIGLGGYSLSQR